MSTGALQREVNHWYRYYHKEDLLAKPIQPGKGHQRAAGVATSGGTASTFTGVFGVLNPAVGAIATTAGVAFAALGLLLSARAERILEEKIATERRVKARLNGIDLELESRGLKKP